MDAATVLAPDAVDWPLGAVVKDELLFSCAVPGLADVEDFALAADVFVADAVVVTVVVLAVVVVDVDVVVV